MRLSRELLNTPRLRLVAELELACILWDTGSTAPRKARTFDRTKRFQLAAMHAARSAQEASAAGCYQDADELSAVCIAFLRMGGKY